MSTVRLQPVAWGDRDPGRVYPPPPLTLLDRVLRWVAVLGWYGFSVAMALIGRIATNQQHRSTTPLALELLDMVLGLVIVVAAAFRRRWRWLALALSVPAALSSSGFFGYCLIVTSLATRRRWREVLPPAALFLVSISAYVWFGSSHADPTLGPLPARLLSTGLAFVFALAGQAIIISFGFYIGARRDLVAALQERAVTAEREAALQVAAAQANERARIAREMHDVLAHRISLVSMHAGVLSYREDLGADETRRIAGIIQENAHAALTELRGVLGSLRAEGAGAPELPQPTLADIGELVAAQESLGQEVHLSDEIKQRELLSPVTARHAYRIVQEALTNARKHAEESPVWVSLYGRPGDGLHLHVRNALTRSGAVPGARMGLVGLRERAGLVGGTLEAGVDHGDFVVRAWLPWEK